MYEVERILEIHAGRVNEIHTMILSAQRSLSFWPIYPFIMAAIRCATQHFEATSDARQGKYQARQCTHFSPPAVASLLLDLFISFY